MAIVPVSVISARERVIDQIERALGCGAQRHAPTSRSILDRPRLPLSPPFLFSFSFLPLSTSFSACNFHQAEPLFLSVRHFIFFFHFLSFRAPLSSDCCSHPIVPLLLCSDISPSCQPSSPLRPPRVKFQHPQTHSIPHLLPATLFRPSHLPRDHLLQPLFAKQTFRDPVQIPSTSSLLPQKIHHSRFISSKLQTRRYIYNPPVRPLPSFTGLANLSSMSLRAVSHARIA
jgi:hypothetical protein